MLDANSGRVDISKENDFSKGSWKLCKGTMEAAREGVTGTRWGELAKIEAEFGITQ